MKRTVLFLLLFALILAIGCSKEDNNNPVAPNEQPPQVSTIPVVQVPTAAPAPIQQQFTLLNQFTTFWYNTFTFLPNVQPVHQGNTWTWMAVNGQLTVTITATEQENDSVYWKVVLNGSDNQGSYQNWVAMDGTLSRDGTSGNWTFYNLNSSEVSATCQWSKDENNNFTATIEIPSAGERVELSVQADGSGQAVIYQNNVKYLEVGWNADGSGWWKEYDDQGNLVNQGNWG